MWRPRGDLDGDGDVDLRDHAIQAANWTGPGPGGLEIIDAPGLIEQYITRLRQVYPGLLPVQALQAVMRAFPD